MSRRKTVEEKMEMYYEKAIKLKEYCEKKGKELVLADGALNCYASEIVLDEEYKEITFYTLRDEKDSRFFAISREMVEENRLGIEFDKKFGVLELGYKRI